MDLNVASEEEIMDELRRRAMIRADAKIAERIKVIDYAYNCGKISRIEIIENNKGTSAESIRYVVVMK